MGAIWIASGLTTISFALAGALPLLDNGKKTLFARCASASFVALACASAILGYRAAYDDALFSYYSKEWYVPLSLSRGMKLYDQVGWLYGPIPPYLVWLVNKITGMTSWWHSFQVAVLIANGIILWLLYDLLNRLYGRRFIRVSALFLLFATYLVISSRWMGSQTLVYPVEAICYLMVLRLNLKSARNLNLLMQGVWLGIGWGAKPFAPLAGLLALSATDWILHARKTWLRTVPRGAIRFFGLGGVLILEATALMATGTTAARVRDALFPFFVREMYRQEHMTFLENFRSAYFGSEITVKYIVLRSLVYLLFVCGIGATAWLALRSRDQIRHVPRRVLRVSLISGFWWILSCLLIWGQWDNHVLFDFLLVIPMAVAWVYHPFFRSNLVSSVAVILFCVALVLHNRLEIGSFVGRMKEPQATIFGVPISEKGEKSLKNLRAELERFPPTLPLIAIGNGASVYELMERKPPWRHVNFLRGMIRPGDLETLQSSIGPRGAVIVNLRYSNGSSGISELFGVPDFSPGLAPQLKDPDEQALYTDWSKNSQLVTSVVAADCTIEVYTLTERSGRSSGARRQWNENFPRTGPAAQPRQN